MSLSQAGIKRTKDGRGLHPFYNIWRHMFNRYTNGSVDKSWFDFWKFESDVSKIYYKKPGKYFCRKDTLAPWSIDNVIFLDTLIEVARHRKNRFKVKIENETVTIQDAIEAAKQKGVLLTETAIRKRVEKQQPILDKKYAERSRKLKKK